MSQYKRFYQAGGYYFFTLVTYQRQPFLTLPENISLLKSAIKKVKQTHPFDLNAMVILPDHLHCIWKLPDNDNNFSTRWRLIKRYFSLEKITAFNHRNEKAVWQRRFWEHFIKDANDWKRHMDYIHYNPVKHKLVSSVEDWPYSSFHHWVKKGLYEKQWGKMEPWFINEMDLD